MQHLEVENLLRDGMLRLEELIDSKSAGGEEEDIAGEDEDFEQSEDSAQYALTIHAKVILNQALDLPGYIISQPELRLRSFNDTPDFWTAVPLPQKSNLDPDAMPNSSMRATWKIKAMRDDQGNVSDIAFFNYKAELFGSEVPVETRWAIFRLAGEYLLHHKQEIKKAIKGKDKIDISSNLATPSVLSPILEPNDRLSRTRNKERRPLSDSDISELDITSSMDDAKSTPKQKQFPRSDLSEPQDNSARQGNDNTGNVTTMDLQMHVGIVIDRSQQPAKTTLFDPKVWIYSIDDDRWTRTPIPLSLVYEERAASSPNIKPDIILCLGAILGITQADNEAIEHVVLAGHEILGEVITGNGVTAAERSDALALAANFLEGVRELLMVELREYVESSDLEEFVSEYDRVLRQSRRDLGDDGWLQGEESACLCGNCPLLDPCGEEVAELIGL